MPRYYFDTDDGTHRFQDETGLGLDDDQQARDEAARAIGELAKEYIPGGASKEHHHVGPK